MKIIESTLNRCLKIRSFRILLANVYPILKKYKIISLLKKLNMRNLIDPFDVVETDNKGIFRTYDLENFNVEEALKNYTINAENLIKLDRKYKFGFLLDPKDPHEESYVKEACKALGVEFIIFNINDPEVIKDIANSGCDGVFINPAFSNNMIRSVYNEIIQIISLETTIPIYPTIRELNLYESKRTVAYFLNINDLPHPKTSIFYDFKEACRFLETCQYPIVFKTNIGASASGVEILENRKQAMKLARQLFNKYYLHKLQLEKRAMEWGYMILQEYIKDTKEYRVIKVGDSWFSYQKWKEKNQVFLSGSGYAKMIGPSADLLTFCYNVADKFHFTTMCFDIFERENGEYLINELQTWFGSYDPSEMYVDNVPGRYRMIEGRWIFEPGFFNIYGSNLLRLTHFISMLQQKES
jgi:glutathione synthase/RimK-type ligase-like ATP-grasp enzyme